MKLKISVAILLVATFTQTVISQTFSENFQNRDVLTYKGALFKVKEDVSDELTTVFYSNFDDCINESIENVLYPDKEWGFNTIMDSMKNRVFIVQDVLNEKGRAFQGKRESSDKAVLVLKDTQNNQII